MVRRKSSGMRYDIKAVGNNDGIYGITRVSVTRKEQDSLPVELQGMCLFFETDRVGEASFIRMVATDGHRLAVMKADVGEEEKDFLSMDKGIIIPRKGLSEIRRLVEEETGDVFISSRDKELIRLS